MAASPRQRRKAAEVIRLGGTQPEAANAAGVNVSTIKRWLDQPPFQAMVSGSQDIRVGAPPRADRPRTGGAFEQDERLRMWVASSTAEKGPGVLGTRIAPDAYENPTAVVHLHVVQPDAVAAVMASIAAGEYPAESHYIPVSLAGLDELLDNLPFVCLLGSADQRESLMAWLEVWTFMRDYDRLASLFTPDGSVRMPHINAEATKREEIRAGVEQMQGLLDYFVQTTHPGTIELEGDTASGRAYISELMHGRDGSSHLNYAVYHDRYQRTPDGWKFTERLYEIRYVDTHWRAPHQREKTPERIVDR